jgi:hypothetical protein
VLINDVVGTVPDYISVPIRQNSKCDGRSDVKCVASFLGSVEEGEIIGFG